MAIPDFRPDGSLPPGLHAGSLEEVRSRFGTGSQPRQQQRDLLTQVVGAALSYSSMKRLLVWGSFVTTKPEPNDLDYSLVVGVDHAQTEVAEAHRRFFVPFEARRTYGVDAGYLLVRDYPLDLYTERLDFLCQRQGKACGIVEISLRGEITGGAP